MEGGRGEGKKGESWREGVEGRELKGGSWREAGVRGGEGGRGEGREGRKEGIGGREEHKHSIPHLLSPCPSCPYSPSPQENTFPSAVSAMACLPPVFTATFLTTYVLRSEMSLGLLTSVKPPQPSRPLVPSPQA